MIDSDPVLCPTGQLFRPSYVGWPRCLGNPDPQGTGSPRPSPAALPPETRNRESPSYRAKAVKGVLGPEASVIDSDPVLCPTGQLFRPSYVGWPRCLGNPDPQGTGSPRPSPAALPPETRNRESPSYKAKAAKGVLGREASGMGSDPQDENGVARRPFSR